MRSNRLSSSDSPRHTPRTLLHDARHADPEPVIQRQMSPMIGYIYEIAGKLRAPHPERLIREPLQRHLGGRAGESPVQGGRDVPLLRAHAGSVMRVGKKRKKGSLQERHAESKRLTRVC